MTQTETLIETIQKMIKIKKNIEKCEEELDILKAELLTYGTDVKYEGKGGDVSVGKTTSKTLDNAMALSVLGNTYMEILENKMAKVDLTLGDIPKHLLTDDMITTKECAASIRIRVW